MANTIHYVGYATAFLSKKGGAYFRLSCAEGTVLVPAFGMTEVREDLLALKGERKSYKTSAGAEGVSVSFGAIDAELEPVGSIETDDEDGEAVGRTIVAKFLSVKCAPDAITDSIFAV